MSHSRYTISVQGQRVKGPCQVVNAYNSPKISIPYRKPGSPNPREIAAVLNLSADAVWDSSSANECHD